MKKRIILASASPRRKEILGKIFPSFDIIPSNAEDDFEEEKPLSPEETVKFLSKIKAEDIFSKNKDALVIGSDTVVSVDGEILGKPKTVNDARNMIKKLSGKCHSVFTGVCIISEEKEVNFACETLVYVSEMDETEIENYIATEEPYDKAGGYGVQGIFAKHIEKLDGDYFNVCGLPASELYRTLKKDFSDVLREEI